MRRGVALALAAAAGLVASGCPTCLEDGELIVVEGGTTLRPGDSAQFSWRWDGRVVSSPEACDGIWAVDAVVGGDAERGTVDSCGRYTAPATLDAPRTVSLSASRFGPGGCADCCPYSARDLRLEPR